MCKSSVHCLPYRCIVVGILPIGDMLLPFTVLHMIVDDNNLCGWWSKYSRVSFPAAVISAPESGNTTMFFSASQWWHMHFNSRLRFPPYLCHGPSLFVSLRTYILAPGCFVVGHIDGIGWCLCWSLLCCLTMTHLGKVTLFWQCAHMQSYAGHCWQSHFCHAPLPPEQIPCPTVSFVLPRWVICRAAIVSGSCWIISKQCFRTASQLLHLAMALSNVRLFSFNKSSIVSMSLSPSTI